MMRPLPIFAYATLLTLGCTPSDPTPSDGGTAGSGSTAGATAHDDDPSETDPGEDGSTTGGSSSDGGTDPPDDGSTGGDETTGGIEGQRIVVGVGNWGHRGMTIDGSRWVEVMNDPPPDGNDHTPDLLRGVGYGDGMFVAVGGDANGMIMTTTDGVTWDEDLFPQGTGWLGDVAYLDGTWVAVGGNGVVVRSTDGGVQWTQNEQSLDSPARTIIVAEGKFVAAGDNGSIAVSPDGLAWDQTFDPSGLGLQLAHGLDTFVGFASQWNGAGFDTACTVSDDAVAWAPCPVSSASFGTPAAGDGAIVVQTEGGYAVTTDGTRWSTVPGDFPSRLVYGDGVWVGLSYMRRWHAPSYEGPWEDFEHPDGFRDLTAGVVAR